jgi:tetratricopeptide (TPR) repeat protein
LDRALLRQHKSDWDGEIADLDRIIAVDPGVSAYYQLRGQAKFDKGDYAGASADYRQSSALIKSGH